MQEPQAPEPDSRRSTIDTSRPFRSVKEAVAIFGERFLAGEIIINPKPFTLPQKEAPIFSPSPITNKSPMWAHTASPSPILLEEAVRKLEVELEEAKKELKVLKERESENEVALAEVRRNVSKLAGADVAPADVAGTSKKLAQILSIGEDEGLFVGRKKERKVRKKKPIVPLVGDLFGRKKGASSNTHLYASSHLQWSI
ncbi:hypothetical protein STAS_16485 [Striga asiatica]|uniref:WEB family protein n=1 Tax=Striga asiatica TaxID=4170 RepID=A0A5A7Q3W6_STRAF|nr:hypothetical protein STAS_16485 [Striga asiatica]